MNLNLRHFLIKITLFYTIVILRHLNFQQSCMSSTSQSESVDTSSLNIDFKMSLGEQGWRSG